MASRGDSKIPLIERLAKLVGMYASKRLPSHVRQHGGKWRRPGTVRSTSMCRAAARAGHLWHHWPIQRGGGKKEAKALRSNRNTLCTTALGEAFKLRFGVFIEAFAKDASLMSSLTKQPTNKEHSLSSPASFQTKRCVKRPMNHFDLLSSPVANVDVALA